MTSNYKIIPDFPHYEVSDSGEVRSKRSGKILKPLTDPGGYLKINLYPGCKTFRIHRLVLECFVGLRATGKEARHLDGNKQNNCLANLCWGTSTENMRDIEAHGTRPKGEDHANATLTARVVLAIRKDFKKGKHTQRELAKKYKLNFKTVHKLVHRRAWRHLP